MKKVIKLIVALCVFTIFNINSVNGAEIKIEFADETDNDTYSNQYLIDLNYINDTDDDLIIYYKINDGEFSRLGTAWYTVDEEN